MRKFNKSILTVAGIIVALVIATIVTVSMATVLLAAKIIVVAASILVLTIVVFAIRWARNNPTKKKVKRRILATLLSIGLIIVLALNVGVSSLSILVNQLLATPDNDQTEVADAQAQTKAMTEAISDEGFVLLENKNNALPLDLDNERNINVFGEAAVRVVYGGSGSGAGDESNNVTLQQGLENAGFKLNSELNTYYEENKPEKKDVNIFNLLGGNFILSEPTLNEDLLAKAEQFSNIALITLARAGGEGGDLPLDTSRQGGSEDRHYLELSEEEAALIDKVTSMDFEKVIVVVNSSHPMELGFLEEAGIDAAIWVGGPGSTGLNSLGKILAGTVNPTGRLVDTYAYDATSSPAYYNAGDFNYVNGDVGGKSADEASSFVNYQEGIYVGYRYYETRYVNNQTGEIDEAAYQDAVQYPFGYGLSYTSFTQEIADYSNTDDTITMTVDVTNTGAVAGKEVVQLYYTAPYYDGGIEKSHVVLGAFEKTSMLDPGATETITLELSVDDMASYDDQNEQAYVLDAGTYEIKLMKNAHDIIDARDYQVTDTIVYNGDNKRATDQVAATTQFEEAAGDLTFVSRADWEGTLPTARAENTEASEALLAALNDRSAEDDPNAEEIVFADHGLELQDMIGLDYDDPKWEQLLEQLSVSDMAILIGYGGYATQEIPSIGKPATVDLDGPAGINGILTGLKGVQITSGVVIASTWNVELIEELGAVIGDEATANGISGIYAPAVNIHRTPFSGRNFEYYSEDSLLSGKIASAYIQGSNTKGVYAYIKHFALNDQESNRTGIAVWSNEQAIREIYLKAFEIPVKEAGADAVMSSYNRIGAIWTGAHHGLLTNVLRGEWGFQGMVITDFDQYEYMNTDQGLRAGNDLVLTPMGDKPSKASTQTDTGNQAMREASHNILYTVANSNVFEIKASYPFWLLFLGLGNIVALGLVMLGFYKLLGRRKGF
ncbi:glycoside hydrolase family 3 protein [Radiobacillus sp. PE A8.2]|uniref:glycoside hydrolase family 3 protein n=1 Tax=Radiobacillus sp. PE A8.2 TaxID=3380349 RepID=UPI003890C8EB